jgi:D-cysteine desulfhydrase
VVGHLLAGLELAEQLPGPPAEIVVPLGSGGTAAGLALAMRVLGWPTRVVAVRVAPALVANRWRAARLARGAAALLARAGIVLPRARAVPFEVVDALGAGYGRPTPAGEAARRLAAEHGLVLDSTYGAKALAALRARAAPSGVVVFWQTFALPVP